MIFNYLYIYAHVHSFNTVCLGELCVCVCFVVISASCLLSVSEFIFQVQTHGYIIMKM